MVYSQQKHRALSFRQADSLRPRYVDLGFGASYFNFRDFATSPLFYHGMKGNFSVFRLTQDEQRDSRQGFVLGFGAASTFGNSMNTGAVLGRLDIIHTELYQIAPDLHEKWNLKIGGMINLSGNIRQNSSFNNNSFGAEALGTLFASFRLGRDVSRTELKTIDLWVCSFGLIPRKRELAFQFNTALVNATYRNAYNYMDHSSIFDEYNYFNRHELEFFSGYRLNTALEYTIHLNNNNAFRLSYLWDAYYTGPKTERFEMAEHQILFSFLFYLNEPVKPGTK